MSHAENRKGDDYTAQACTKNSQTVKNDINQSLDCFTHKQLTPQLIFYGIKRQNIPRPALVHETKDFKTKSTVCRLYFNQARKITSNQSLKQ
ncbi:MAG: hypothetical protein ACRC6G_05935, partial [Deefgea sp.]